MYVWCFTIIACDSMTITVEINHHGSFHNDARNPRYIGGYVDVIKEFDADCRLGI